MIEKKSNAFTVPLDSRLMENTLNLGTYRIKTHSDHMRDLSERTTIRQEQRHTTFRRSETVADSQSILSGALSLQRIIYECNGSNTLRSINRFVPNWADYDLQG